MFFEFMREGELIWISDLRGNGFDGQCSGFQ